MIWGLAITAVIAAAVGYGYWDHTRESGRLSGYFKPLAATYQGALQAGTWLALPQLRFEMDGRRFLVTAMANSGAIGPRRGPFTLVEVNLPFDSGQEMLVEESRGLAREVGDLVDAVTPGRQPMTGDTAFDAAFRIKGNDQAFAGRLLGEPVRQKILASRLPRLEVRVAGPKIGVHIDGYAKSLADLEEMVEIAVLLADHCLVDKI